MTRTRSPASSGMSWGPPIPRTSSPACVRTPRTSPRRSGCRCPSGSAPGTKSPTGNEITGTGGVLVLEVSMVDTGECPMSTAALMSPTLGGLSVGVLLCDGRGSVRAVTAGAHDLAREIFTDDHGVVMPGLYTLALQVLRAVTA